MKKIYAYLFGAMVMALPVSLVAVAGLPAINGIAEEETTAVESTINFQDSTYATSTSTTTDGDITAPLTLQVGEGTMTISANASGTANRFWAVSGKPQLRVYGGTIDFEAPEGRAITKIVFTTKKMTSPTFNPASQGTSNTEWTGNASKVTMNIGGNSQINSITVTYDNANDETVKPEVKVITFDTVADIAAFNALPKDSAVRLTLTNAYVTKVYKGNIYVQDATGAVIFYNTGLSISEGQMLNGSIIGKASPYNGTPEFVANDSTSLDKVTITEGTATPKDVTLAALSTSDLSQLVKLGEAQLIDSADAHYAVQGTDTMQVYDQFKVLADDYTWPETAKSITAIVGSYKNAIQLLPVNADAIEEKPAPVLTDGTYYLYNVGAGKWLCAGNSWGTQASVDDHGLDFTVATLEDGTYTIDSRVFNTNEQHYLSSNAYVDGPTYGWTATDVTAEGATAKTITLSTAEGKFLSFSGEGSVVTTTDDGTADNAKWIAVSKEQRISDIMAALENASEENPVDVTLLFQGTNFGRNDKRNDAWQGSPSIGGNNPNYCAEKYDCQFDVNQTATVPNGVYMVVYQGLYRDGGYTAAAAAHSAGTENLNATAYAGSVEKAVPSIFTAANQLSGVGVSTDLGSIPNSMADASKYFSADLYNDTISGVSVTTGSLKIGIKQTSNGTSSNWTIFDNFRIFCTSNKIDLSTYKEAYETALAAAQEAQKDTVVTGSEMTALNTTVEQYGTVAEETMEAYIEATDALTQATETVTNAHTSYKTLADTKANVKEYPYASAEKVGNLKLTIDAAPETAAMADSLTTALQLAERIVAESNIMAEADTTATDMTSSILNPTANEAIDANVWKVSSGKIGIKSNEPWTDADGNTEHKYFDSDNWSTSAWTSALTQNVKLEEGKYILSVISRASSTMGSFKLFAKVGDSEVGYVDMPCVGASGQLFNRGWNRSYIVFDVPADTTVTIGVEGATTTVHSWMSFSDFRLVQFTGAPHLTGSFEADTYTALEANTERDFHITLVNDGKATVASHTVNVGYVYMNGDETTEEKYTEWTCPDIAAGDTLQHTVAMSFAKTGTYYVFLADELTGDTIHSSLFDVVTYDRDTTITIAPTDTVWYSYVGEEKNIDIVFAHTGTSGVIDSFYVYVGYLNADNYDDYGYLNPYYAYSGELRTGETDTATVAWTPIATGTYYIFCMTEDSREFYTAKTIKVFATKEEMDNFVTGVNNISADTKAAKDVYTINGQLVRKNANSLMGLPKGIYVVGGKKLIVK